MAGTLVTPAQHIEIIRDDPDDNRIIECVAAANADYLATGDAHLLSLRRYQAVEIVNPSDFLSMLL